MKNDQIITQIRSYIEDLGFTVDDIECPADSIDFQNSIEDGLDLCNKIRNQLQEIYKNSKIK